MAVCHEYLKPANMETDTFYRYSLTTVHHTYLLLLLPLLCENLSPWNNVACPPLCNCVYEDFPYVVADRALATIDCSQAELNRVPANISSYTEALVLRGGKLPISALGQIPPNLTLLDASHCQLYTLDYGWPIMPFMRYLNLGHNDLDYLANRTFQTMPGLVGLYLSHNTIEIFHSDGLCGLSSLHTLDLSHNRLFTLDTRWFRDLKSLKNLLLHDNNIHQVPGKPFSNLTSLEILTLHSNQIKILADDGFRGLAKLSTLLLNNNHLAAVTSKPFHVFKDLDLLDLGNNHIERLSRGSLQYFNVSTLRLNNMRNLKLIERRAIVNIGTLTELDLSGNAALMYIERRAFVGLPKLHRIRLHGGNLTTLEAEVVGGLSALSTMSLYDNPLYCDCTLAWLARLMRQHRHNVSLEGPEKMSCRTGPPDLQSQPLQSVPVGQLMGQCAPRILPLFGPNHQVLLGDTIQLDCRAVGQPVPQITWLLPAEDKEMTEDGVRMAKASSQVGFDGRITVSESGTLTIKVIQNGDQGQWTCIANSPRGRDQKSVTVRLRNPRANVILISVTSTSISVTWKSTKYQRDYELLYREVNVNESYTVVNILPYMRSYTASHLLPKTKYEFCIAVTHQSVTTRLNCSVISTNLPEGPLFGTMDPRNTILGGSIACLLVLVIFITTVCFMIRRYNKRRRSAEELLGADYLSQVYLAGMDPMSDTTPITYENRGIDLGSEEDDEEEEELTEHKPNAEEMYR